MQCSCGLLDHHAAKSNHVSTSASGHEIWGEYKRVMACFWSASDYSPISKCAAGLADSPDDWSLKNICVLLPISNTTISLCV